MQEVAAGRAICGCLAMERLVCWCCIAEAVCVAEVNWGWLGRAVLNAAPKGENGWLTTRQRLLVLPSVPACHAVTWRAAQRSGTRLAVGTYQAAALQAFFSRVPVSLPLTSLVRWAK